MAVAPWGMVGREVQDSMGLVEGLAEGPGEVLAQGVAVDSLIQLHTLIIFEMALFDLEERIRSY